MTRRRSMMALALALLAGACGGGGAQVPGLTASSPGPALVVERFLQAANRNDLDTMMGLFGSGDQTIMEIEGRSRAEQRMYLLASLLRHDDYAIIHQEPVAGRSRTAARLDVQLMQGEQSTVVPHVVVRKSDGGWIIERIHVEEITSG